MNVFFSKWKERQKKTKYWNNVTETCWQKVDLELNNPEHIKTSTGKTFWNRIALFCLFVGDFFVLFMSSPYCICYIFVFLSVWISERAYITKIKPCILALFNRLIWNFMSMLIKIHKDKLQSIKEGWSYRINFELKVINDQRPNLAFFWKSFIFISIFNFIFGLFLFLIRDCLCWNFFMAVWWRTANNFLSK